MVKYFKTIWLGFWTAVIGMKITFIHLFRHNVTIQYPKERFPIPDGTNGTHVGRNRLEMDMDLCEGCRRCARICPVDCIEIETIMVVKTVEQPTLKNGDRRPLWVPKYEIDFSKCCFCGLCTTVCPTNAIYHTTEFEYSTYQRGGKVEYWLGDKKDYDKAMLYSFVNQPKEFYDEKARILAEDKKRKAAEKAAKVKEAAAKKAAEENDNKNENK
jgi:NADH-quinone oxidoreductase subunit I